MVSTARRPRRRLVRNVLLAVLFTASVALAAWMFVGPDTPGADEEVAAVGGLFVGVAALAVAVADYFRPERRGGRLSPGQLADDLAGTIEAQWLEDHSARGLREPGALPLVWVRGEPGTGDGPDGVAGFGGQARVTRVRFGGHGEGRLDELSRALAEGFHRLPAGRLVVLGEPGAGKSVTAVLLALGLLTGRACGDPVPVVVSVASWDPVVEALDGWLVRTLADLYYAGVREVPRQLLDHGLLLPVLDGLDEIPEAARPLAVRAINAAGGRDRAVVVTCRTAEYEDVIDRGSPVLRRAPVVRIAPVAVGDAITYLAESDWPAGCDWEPVFVRMAAAPDSPVAAALSTPLMLALARLVYTRCGGDPAELLDADRFDCRQAVEDHLTDRVIDAVYAPAPSVGGLLPQVEPPPWSPEQARGWLAYLARSLHRHRERDIAWWQLPDRLLPRWAGPVIGIVAGLALMTGMVAVARIGGGDTTYLRLLPVSAATGGAFALFTTIVWYASAGRPPGRLLLDRRRSWWRLRRGLVTGLLATAYPAVPVVIGVAGTMVAEGLPLGYARVLLVLQALATAVVISLLVGLTLGLHSWLVAPPERSGHTGPAASLAQDRRSALVGAAVAGTVFGLGVVPAMALGLSAGTALAQLLSGYAGRPGRLDLPGILAGQIGAFAHPEWPPRAVVIGLGAVLPGVAFAVLVLLARAWTRFTVLRLVLALRGELPWRLMPFLADARERELLRQTAGTFQFRHLRLQQRLAHVPDDRPHSTPPLRLSPPALIRRRAVVGAAVLGCGLLAWQTISGGLVSRNTARTTIAPPADGPDSSGRDGADGAVPRLTAVGFAATGPQVVTVDATGTVCRWDARAEGALRQPLAVLRIDRQPSPIVAVWLDPARGVFVTGTADGAVLAWSAVDGHAISRTAGPLHPPTAVGWNPDATAFSADLSVGAAAVPQADGPAAPVSWRVADGLVTRHPQQPGATVRPSSAVPGQGPDATSGPWYVAVSPTPGGVVLAAVDGDGTVRLWPPTDRQAVPVNSGPPVSADASAGADVSAGADGPGPLVIGPSPTGPGPAALAVAPDGEAVAVGSSDGPIAVWRSAVARDGGGWRVLTGHTARVNTLVFDPRDGRTLLSGSDDGTARVWTLPT